MATLSTLMGDDTMLTSLSTTSGIIYSDTELDTEIDSESDKENQPPGSESPFELDDHGKFNILYLGIKLIY